MADYEYIVEMKHITKRFPGIVANDDVTVQIKKGEICASWGKRCGKIHSDEHVVRYV